jgi:hypothetical protein
MGGRYSLNVYSPTIYSIEKHWSYHLKYYKLRLTYQAKLLTVTFGFIKRHKRLVNS